MTEVDSKNSIGDCFSVATVTKTRWLEITEMCYLRVLEARSMTLMYWQSQTPSGSLGENLSLSLLVYNGFC